MEVTLPLKGTHRRSWVRCRVTGQGKGPGRFSVSLDGYPELDGALQDVPGAALRNPTPESAVVLRGRRARHAATPVVSSKAIGTLTETLFDCGRFPKLCQRPFSCEFFRMKEALTWYFWGTGRTGQGNPRGFCAEPGASLAISAECLAGPGANLLSLGANHTMRRDAVESELQASRCFLEGFCADERVTPETSRADANRICDERYGHKRWTAYGTFQASPEDAPPLDPPARALSGYSSRKQTTPITLAACATGRFQCDVLACKQNFCKDPEWRSKHLELSWAERPEHEVEVSTKPTGTRGKRSMEEWQVLLRNKLASGKS